VKSSKGANHSRRNAKTKSREADVYQRSIEFLAVALQLLESIPKRNAMIIDQLKRTSTSAPPNITEGAGDPAQAKPGTSLSGRERIGLGMRGRTRRLPNSESRQPESHPKRKRTLSVCSLNVV
jgi:hypothetical protein